SLDIVQRLLAGKRRSHRDFYFQRARGVFSPRSPASAVRRGSCSSLRRQYRRGLLQSLLDEPDQVPDRRPRKRIAEDAFYGPDQSMCEGRIAQGLFRLLRRDQALRIPLVVGRIRSRRRSQERGAPRWARHYVPECGGDYWKNSRVLLPGNRKRVGR